jgi:hypothetical protein
MKLGNLKYVLYGYAGFCVVNYLISKATAGQLRTGTSFLTVNDSLANLNVLTYVLGAPTAPLAPGITPVVTTDTVVVAPSSGVSGLSNVVRFPATS